MIYFDNAATTFHKPQEVIDAITKALTTMGNAGRGGNLVSIDSNRAIFNARENVAKFFNILKSVAMIDGSVINEKGKDEYTVYTSCYSSKTNKLYYNRYNDFQIRSYTLDSSNMNSNDVTIF